MQFTNETPRAEVTIQGLKFTVPQPFETGHVCNVNEAMALNQTLAENIRNNFAARLKANEEKPENEREVLDQAALDEYVADYEFGVRRSAEARLSPDEREARNIARDVIKAQLKAKNMSAPDKVTMENWIKELAGQEQVLKAARRRVKELSGIAVDALQPTQVAA